MSGELGRKREKRDSVYGAKRKTLNQYPGDDARGRGDTSKMSDELV
jgi:hypothetical protein